MTTSNTPKPRKVRIRESVSAVVGEIGESQGGARGRTITIREAITAGTVNRNGRRYTEAAIRAAVLHSEQSHDMKEGALAWKEKRAANFTGN